METDLNDSAVLMAGEYAGSTVSFSWPWRTILVLVVSDACAVTVSLALASILRDWFLRSPSHPVFDTIPPALLLVLCSFLSSGLYSGVSLDPVEEVRRVCVSVTLAFLTLLSGTLFLHDLSLSRVVYAFSWALCLAVSPLFRAFSRSAFSTQSWWGSPVAILGGGSMGKLVLKKLREQPTIGLRPFAVLDDDPEHLNELDQDLVQGPLSDCRSIAVDHRLPYGIVCMPEISRDELLALLSRYGQCFGHLIVIPNLIGMASLGITARNMGGIVGLEVRQELLRPAARIIKRGLDLGLTVLLAPLLLPVVLVSSLMILLEGIVTGRRGPVFYKCDRIGLGGRVFKVWKLRSMVPDGDRVLGDYFRQNPAEYGHWLQYRKLKRDPRITAVGRVLRKTSIDEMPQFWNVLAGEMSVVGPRPIQEDQVEIYGSAFSLYKQVRPGITGLWQVSGRNHLAFSERVNLDRYCIQNWSVWLDIYVIALTLRVLMTAEGAY